MSIRIHRLILTGPDKAAATLDFGGMSHLVFGPTDTGKSYVVECLRYGLGGSRKLRDIGFSEGYTRLALQISTDVEEKYTFFRDLHDGEEIIYPGFQEHPPQHRDNPVEKTIASLLVSSCNGANKKIIVKSGVRENISAGDLRYFSLFDEIETLNNVSLIGSDTNLQVRHKSALSLILSGADDSSAIMPPSTKERSVAKGYVEAIKDEIAELKANLPNSVTEAQIKLALDKVNSQLDQITSYYKTNEALLKKLKSERQSIQRQIRVLIDRRAALLEAQARFLLLNEKYKSDVERLQTITSAASIIDKFELRPCPICHTEYKNQTLHKHDLENNYSNIVLASQTEAKKIHGLQTGLKKALSDIETEIQLTISLSAELEQKERDNTIAQTELLSPNTNANDGSLSVLSEKREQMNLALRDMERIKLLEIKLKEKSARTKRKNQQIERNLSLSADKLCKRIHELLSEWTVPGVTNIYFNEVDVDIMINQRQRISFGKGKRGVFLTAYVIALMEQALENKSPHLGCVAIDSPVVTYKDPKHRGDGEDALEPIVKDRFYSWLANRNGPGQIVILENEEPQEDALSKILHTEFIGIDSASSGRKGFFPI